MKHFSVSPLTTAKHSLISLANISRINWNVLKRIDGGSRRSIKKWNDSNRLPRGLLPHDGTFHKSISIFRSRYSNRLHKKLLVREILITEGKRTVVGTDAEFTKFTSIRIHASPIFSSTYRCDIIVKPSTRNFAETVMKIFEFLFHINVRFFFSARYLFEVLNFNFPDCQYDKRKV